MKISKRTNKIETAQNNPKCTCACDKPAAKCDCPIAQEILNA